MSKLESLPANPYNAHSWVVGEPVIGEGVWIGAFCVIDGSGGLTIGAGCNISSGAQLGAACACRTQALGCQRIRRLRVAAAVQRRRHARPRARPGRPQLLCLASSGQRLRPAAQAR